MKNFLLLNQSFGTVGSPNQTGETLTRENRIGLMSYLRRTLMLLFAILVMSIGQMWGVEITINRFALDGTTILPLNTTNMILQDEVEFTYSSTPTLSSGGLSIAASSTTTISAHGKTITGMTIVFNNANNTSTVNTGSITGWTNSNKTMAWSGSATSITITSGVATRINSAEITYTDATPLSGVSSTTLTTFIRPYNANNISIIGASKSPSAPGVSVSGAFDSNVKLNNNTSTNGTSTNAVRIVSPKAISSIVYTWTTAPSTVATSSGSYDSGTSTWTAANTTTTDVSLYNRGSAKAQFSQIVVNFVGGGSTYTVTYNGNGKDGGGDAPSDGNSPYASGATVTVLGNTNSMTKTGYTFDGWNTAANMSGTSYAAAGTFSISTNTTLYAKWKQTITLDDEDATTAVSPTSVTAYYNSATLPSITNPEKTGYMFAGWYTGDDGTGDLVINTSGELQANVTGYTGAGGIWTSSSARTLYAKWEDPIYEDKIVWNKNSSYGGDGKCMSADDANSSSLTKNNNDKNDIGHSYVQISNTNTGMDRPAAVDDVFTLTFTAKSGYYIQSICSYGKIEETGGAYYSWDGGTSWTNIAKYASMATKTFDAPDATEPTSFIIKYTCTDTDAGGMYWRNAVVTLGETAPTYTVTYDANGGSGTMTDSNSPYEAGATVTVLENEFTKPGYPFAGWSAVDASSNVIDVSSGSFTMPSSNVTITAQWGVALVDEFLDKEHGNSRATRSGVPVLPTPTLSDFTPVNSYCNDLHYKFIGWVISTSVNDDGTLKNDAEIVPGEQSGWNCTGATYYAVWAAENK